MYYLPLFYLIYDRGKGCRVVHSQVGENLAVEVDAGIPELAHKHRIGKAVFPCTCIDALDPQCPEFTFSLLAIPVCVYKALFDGVLGHRPDVFSTSEIPLSLFQYPFPAGTGGYIVN